MLKATLPPLAKASELALTEDRTKPPRALPKVRADVALVTQGLADSRTRAQAMILAGVVLRADDAQRIDKPGALIGAEVMLAIKGEPMPFVSRGGLKLQAAMAEFGVSAQGRTCLDVGASTGGFTDCLLQGGASHVFAVDVGTNQLAWRLRQDPRVTSLERTNMREVTPQTLGSAVSLIVADVSFISLTLVLPAAVACLAPGGEIVVLVKPQFEVGRGLVGKGGIVRDVEGHKLALQRVTSALPAMGLHSPRTMPSPILGAKGNHEFLLHAMSAK